MMLLSNGSQVSTWFIPLIVAFLTPLSMFGITALQKRLAEKANEKVRGKASGTVFKVKNAKILFGCLIFLDVLTLSAVLLFLILYLCDIPDGPPLEIVIAIVCSFGAIGAACIVFSVAVRRWEISVTDERIEYNPYFGKKRVYLWEDITSVKVTLAYDCYRYQVFANNSRKKAFVFTQLMPGGAILAQILSQKGLIQENLLL